MNRLILIGNGFDKAHGLATSYKEFISWYWNRWIGRLSNSEKQVEEDGLCTFRLSGGFTSFNEAFKQFSHILENVNGYEAIRAVINASANSLTLKHNILLERICASIENKGWVDIEEEYYSLLKEVTSDQATSNDMSGYSYFDKPDVLNKDLSQLTEYLIEYLNAVQQNLDKSLKNEGINDVFYGPILQDEISVFAQKEYADMVRNNIKFRPNEIDKYIARCYRNYVNLMSDLEAYKTKHTDRDNIDIKEIMDENPDLLKILSLPDKILVVSFNYTNTESLYTKKYGVDVVHIHGKLDEPDTVIFGYGDELDESYKNIKDKKDNEYLKNIKSVRYLESENYRKVLKFVESGLYQICILGHSCGTSDRTLLNTLFEYKNCISVKPYFFERNGKDNYLDIIGNIVRDFTDMERMRDIVVNKTRCAPLPQSEL